MVSPARFLVTSLPKAAGVTHFTGGGGKGATSPNRPNPEPHHREGGKQPTTTPHHKGGGAGAAVQASCTALGALEASIAQVGT